MAIELEIANEAHIDLLLPLVRAYHDFEKIHLSEQERQDALMPLLLGDNLLGRIWLIRESNQIVGYIALCFGYSIEFGGRDAFVDEFFIEQSARGKGIGHYVLEAIKRKALEFNVLALHLEVERENDRAKNLYRKAGFESRHKFHLMSWVKK